MDREVMNTEQGFDWSRHFSIGDLISLAAVLIALGAGWNKLDNVAKEVSSIKVVQDRGSITEGRVTALEYRVANAERDRIELKTDIADRLKAIDSKLELLAREQRLR